MKEVFALIEAKKQEFAQTPFIKFLQDKSIHPKRRLAFAPCFAPVAMGFADLNKYVWRDESSKDPIQAIINQYTYEDDHHWIWFLEDMQDLDCDLCMNFNDALKFLWSDETQLSRQTIHEIYKYTYQAIPIYKLVVIETIEAIADIFLPTTALVTEELKVTTNRQYKYFGDFHTISESNHTMHTSEVADEIANFYLDEETTKGAFELVNKVFDLFVVLVDDLVFIAKNYNIEDPLKHSSVSNYRSMKQLHNEVTELLISGRQEIIFADKKSQLTAVN